MNRPVLSVIIPVHNVSKHLPKCLDSVLNQTLKKIEIILVNDCSPDPEDDRICRNYSEQDGRIVYIKHNANKGQGGARNTGIRLAKAEIIGFVDSDDFLHPKMYEIMYKYILDGNMDIVDCGIEKVDSHQCTIGIYLKHQSNTILFGNEGFHTFLEKNQFRIYPTCWNKVWRKSLFTDNQVYFTENEYFEDGATTPRILFFAKRVQLIPDILYFYTQREESFMKSGQSKYLYDFKNVTKRIKRFLENQGAYGTYKKDYNQKVNNQISSWFYRDIVKAKMRSDPKLLFLFVILFWKNILEISLRKLVL